MERPGKAMPEPFLEDIVSREGSLERGCEN